MAISALVAVEPVADELVEKIKDRMGKLRNGDGTKGCDMGPLVTKAHRDKVAGYVDAGVQQGATWSSTAATTSSTVARTATSSAPRCSTTSART